MTKGRLVGRIFTVICVLIAVLSLMFSIYLGGQEKTADSYYTAVTRNDFSEFDSLFCGGTAPEGLVRALSKEYEELSRGFDISETSLMHVRINFRRREFLSLTENKYFYTVTYYDDGINSHTTDELSFDLRFEGMKWKIV